MKLLWITNILFPEAVASFKDNSELNSTGGWLLGSAKALLEHPDVELHVATVSQLVSKLKVIHGKHITYYVIPYGKGNQKYNKEYEKYWIEINKMILPDIVHIHGTEFTHGLAYVNACGNENVVVSIQGLKSAYYYYYYGMTSKDILVNLTFHDLIKGGLFRAKKKFQKTSKFEIELLRKVDHIIGRTTWDRARTWAINPKAEYHFCNETLREEFYDGSLWDYSRCTPHSLFLSQAGYPIKGLHQLLKALPIILRHYPGTIVRVAGSDITRSGGVWGLLHFTSYGKYIKKLIRKNHLEDKVKFIGNLNAEQMKHEYLRSNIFVCPSTIENSPNSLGEAQILGVPCVASYVGGIMDMMRGNEENMYRFEEVEMLAKIICDIFRSRECVNTSALIVKAKKRHSPDDNIKCLIDIYKEIF